MALLEIYSTQDIVEYMESVFPAKPQSNYESIAQKYIDICVSECLKGYINSDDPDKIDFRLTTLKDNILNRYDGNKYWLPHLKQQFPFFYTIQRGWRTGDVAVISSVKPLFHEYALLAHYMDRDYGELLQCLHPVKQHNKIVTPIDTRNLQWFIDNTMEDLDNPKLAKGKQSLIKQLYQAKSILDIAQQNNNTLPQNYSQKDTGRTYMSGINLQNCSSRVREAALGACHKYDLRTAMFGHMLQKISDRFPDFNIKQSYIAEYVHNKNRIRSELARDCIVETQGEPDFKVKLIKKTLAAIGFGANVSNSRGAIQQNIWHEGDRNRLLNNAWMKGLLGEVELYREIMRATYPRAKREFGDALKKNGRSSLSKWCSFEYQLTESAVVHHVINTVKPDVLLQVHDAIYVRTRCDLIDLNTTAHQISPLANFEHEHIGRIQFNKGVIRRATQTEAEHKQRIKYEEAEAKAKALCTQA